MAQASIEENVADYPRPPRLEPTKLHLRVVLDGHVVAETTNAFRVLETHHPPTYYIPPEDCTPGLIVPNPGRNTMCEWKGKASYWDVQIPHSNRVLRRCWSYQTPTPAFTSIAGYYSFYASPFECYVEGEKVQAQPGDFYGGWQTSGGGTGAPKIVGPIKGAPGTMFW